MGYCHNLAKIFEDKLFLKQNLLQYEFNEVYYIFSFLKTQKKCDFCQVQ